MIYSVAVLTNLLLAAGVLAAPKGSGLAGRLERRREGRQSMPMKPAENLIKETEVSTSSHVQYSSNWAGCVYDTQTSATFTTVTGTFTVPKVTGSSGASASAWVGIDGDTCGNAILQTGLDFTVSGSGSSYDAWYEWYPAYAYDFSGISFSAGDSVTLTVTASSTKAGSAVIKNNTKGTSVSKSLTSSSALCEYNAEWIVEDYEEGSSQVTLANWGTVTFTNAYATSKSGTTYSAGSSDTIDMQNSSGQTITSVTQGSNSCAIKYV